MNATTIRLTLHRGPCVPLVTAFLSEATEAETWQPEQDALAASPSLSALNISMHINAVSVGAAAPAPPPPAPLPSARPYTPTHTDPAARTALAFAGRATAAGAVPVMQAPVVLSAAAHLGFTLQVSRASPPFASSSHTWASLFSFCAIEAANH